MSRRSTIGFDRKLELEWLDFTAAKAAEELAAGELRAQLLSHLDTLSHQNGAYGSARSKTATVLMRIWGGMEPEIRPLRDRALQALTRVEPDERLSLHWAMIVAAYPFFADVASSIGRLLSLHEVVSLAQLQRRVAEQWGERSTVLRAVRRVVHSMIAWGVLDDAGKGVYRRRGERREAEGEIAQLLLEAILLDSEQEMLALEQASKHPALFPFDVRVSTQQLRQSDRFRISRQGLNTEVVALAK